MNLFSSKARLYFSVVAISAMTSLGLPLGVGARQQSLAYAQQASTPVATSQKVARAHPTASGVGGNPLWKIPMNSLMATVRRPIFSPSRRPPVVIAPAPFLPARTAEISQPVRPPLVLIGAIAGTRGGIAIVINEGTKGIFRLRTGETQSGWMLRSVQGREATFERGTQSAVISIPLPAR